MQLEIKKVLNLIELTYETDGQVHVISGEDIDVSLNRVMELILMLILI